MDARYYRVGELVGCRCPHPIVPEFWWWIPGLVTARKAAACTTRSQPPVYNVRIWLPDGDGWLEEVLEFETDNLAPWPSDLLPLPGELAPLEAAT